MLMRIPEHAKQLLSRLIATLPNESTDKDTTASVIANIDAKVNVRIIDESIDLLSSLPDRAPADTREKPREVDALGVKLWNTSTRISRFLDDGDHRLEKKEIVNRGSR